MSTLVEDRLAAALRARAELVGPEDLGPLEVPEATRGPRRPLLAGLAAAAAVAAVAVPLAAGGSDQESPAPPVSSATPSPSPSATPFAETSRAEGDVDGDGAADLVRTDQDGRVRVDLADGSVAGLQQPLGAAVEGLADVGTPGLAVVLGIDSGDERPAHVLRWVDGGLEEVDTVDGAWIGSTSGQTFWVEDHVLYTGTFEGTLGEEPVSVATRAWLLRGGLLRSRPVGQRCWQPSEQEPHPVSCSSGQGGGAGVGTSDGLPPLLPAVDQGLVHERFRWESAQPGDYAQLQGELDPDGGPVADGQVRLVVVVGGTEHRAAIPAGGSPELVPQELTGIDGDTPVLLVRQSDGDTEFMRVYSIRDDGLLKQVEPVGDLFLGSGSGFVKHVGEVTEQRTWISTHGQLFTAVSLDRGTQRHQLWRWNDNLGDTTTPTDLGVVCIDWATDDYGRCS